MTTFWLSKGVSVGDPLNGGGNNAVVFTDSSGNLKTDSSNFVFDDTKDFLGVGVTPALARVHIGGTISSAAWLANGIQFRTESTTITDTSSSGSLSTISGNAFGTPTFAASSSVTWATAATVYITAAPVAGTNTTITESYGLFIASGKGYVAGYWGIGGSAPTAQLQLGGSYTQAAWTLNGIGIKTLGNQTFTDSSSSGTVASTAIHVINTPTLVASSSTTYTNSATWYIASAPTASTNVTQTNSYAVWVDAGNTRLDGLLSVGTSAAPNATIAAGGNTSQVAWTTNGVGLRFNAATYTDTTSSGTVSQQGVYAFGTPTLIASSSTTYTDSATVYIASAPTSSTNVTQTRPWALYSPSSTGNWYAAGDMFFGTAKVNSISMSKVQCYVECLPTDPATNPTVAIGGRNNITITANNAINTFGIYGRGQVAHSTFDYTGTVQSIGASTTVTGTSGTVTKAIGMSADVRNTGSGTLQLGTGFTCLFASNSGGGTFTTFRQFEALDSSVGTNNFGFWTNMSAGSNKWAIQTSGTAQSAFGGLTSFGSITAPAAVVHIQGNQTAAAWTVNGIGLRTTAATYTDSSSSGTVGSQAVHAFGTATLAASSSTTYTDAASVYISNRPSAGSNVTITTGWAVWVDAGDIRADGKIQYATSVNPVNVVADAATITFDLSVSNHHRTTLGGNRTLAISNASVGQYFTIEIIQDGTGTRVPAFFTTIKWPGAVAPTLTTTINKTDVFGFIVVSAGNYLGFVIGQSL